MLRYMWNKNKKLCKVAIFAMSSVIIIGTLFVIDTIQKEQRNANSNGLVLTENTGEIPAYNVEGMTDKEIQEFLEELRNGKK